MIRNVIPYSSYAYTRSSIGDDIEEILITRDLVHYTSMLLKECQLTEKELENAIQKAIMACASAGIRPTNHFRVIFVCARDRLKKDWLVSNLALQLIMLNADVSNPIIARLQITVLTNQLYNH